MCIRDRGPRDEQRSGADRKDFRARDGKPTGGSAPRKDFGPRADRGPRRDSREAGHPREVFIDGKLMAAPDQDVPQDRGPRFDGPRDGGRGGAPRRDQVRRQKAHKATTARELALAAIHQLKMCIRDRCSASCPPWPRRMCIGSKAGSVSYTHLDVYKRQ